MRHQDLELVNIGFLSYLLQDIKKAIPNVENFIVHNHCLQFRIKIRNSNSPGYGNGNVNNNNSNNNNNETHVSGAVIDNGLVLSDLFNKLHSLTVGRGITYTITECLLDQVSIGNDTSKFGYTFLYDANVHFE